MNTFEEDLYFEELDHQRGVLKESEAFEADRKKWFEAALMGRWEVLKKMRENGWDLNVKNSRGESALTHAIVGKHLNIVTWLLEDPAFDKKAVNDDGSGPFHQIQVLRNRQLNQSIMNVLKTHGFNINHQDALGETMLHRFVKNLSDTKAFMEGYDFLISNGLDPLLKNLEKESALDWLRKNNKEWVVVKHDLEKIIARSNAKAVPKTRLSL